MQQEDNRSENGTAALRKGLSVLKCFTWDRTSMSLKELAAVLEYPTPTVARLVKALKEECFLEQDRRTKLYSLGLNSYILGVVAHNSGILRNIAVPHMRALVSKYNETVNLYVRDGDLRVCYAQVESTQALKQSARLGVSLPLVAGASGRCFLAFMPEEEVRRIIGEPVAFTENTITDAEMIMERLRILRESGYTVSTSERELGVSSVASPILDASSRPIACLAVSGPSLRFSDSIIERLIPDLKLNCYEISLKMGANKKDIDFLNK